MALFALKLPERGVHYFTILKIEQLKNILRYDVSSSRRKIFISE